MVAGFVLGLMTLVVADECGSQQFLDPNSYSYGLDVNEIAVDPVSGNRLLLAVVTTEISRTWSYQGYGCDPDGDTLTFESEAELSVDGVTYTLTGMVGAVGLYYYDVSCTDTPSDPNQTPLTRTGTVAVVGLPTNQAPVLCGGTP